MLTLLTASSLRWMEKHRRRARLRALLARDDRTLDDIGLTRLDIEATLAEPFDRHEDPIAEAKRRSRITLGFDRRVA
jgi:uncharacterized protein YjiS (DUF1127 family)